MSRFAVVISCALAVAACSGVKVESDWNPSIDFSQYSTYGWLEDVETDGSNVGDAFTDQRITAAIDNELRGKGLRKVDSGGDLMVGFQVTTRENTSYQTTGTAWGGGGYRWGYYGGGGMATTTQTTRAVHSTVGTLVIGLFDSQSKQMVWHANGSKTIKEGGTPDQRAQRIDEAVAKIMMDFPPSSS